MRYAIVLAAGKGTRMKSTLVKPMHKVLDKPMVEHIADNLIKTGVDKIVTIVGFGAEAITSYLKDKSEFAVQEVVNGTGSAVKYAKQLEGLEGYTLVVNGDCPLIQSETFEMMFEEVKGCGMAVLSAVLTDAKSYGRIIRDENGEFVKITEFKDCSEEEKLVKEINTGIYVFDNKLLFEYLPLLTNNNAQQEYYITDLVEIFKSKNQIVKAIQIADPDEAMGVNDRYELSLASKWLQRKINKQLMLNGVTIIDPENTYIGPDVIIGEDTVIYPNTFIEGKSVIGKNNVLQGANMLRNVTIGDNNFINNMEITDSVVDDNTELGPYSHFRNGCHIHSNTRVGNFVEMKNTNFGEGSKCAHLTYVGDATVGKRVNFGCGTVTVNYDGSNKWHTTIGDDVFIGCNVNLIAPVEVKDRCVLAAGTTITDTVEPDDMAIGRVRQENKPGYGKRYLDKGRKIKEELKKNGSK